METEIIRAESVEIMQRAEIDLQVATARRYPRDEGAAVRRVIELCSASREMAAECSFSISPADGRGAAKEGPSVRFAEVLFQSWGNLRGAARAVEVLETEVIGQGVCFDLERNVAIEREVRRRIVTKDGKRYGATGILETANAAASIAFRNAVLVCIPKPVWVPAYRQIRAVAAGAAGAVESRELDAPPEATHGWARRTAERGLEWFAARGAPAARVLAALGLQSAGDATAAAVETMRSWRDQIEAGAATVDDCLGPPAISTGARNGRPGRMQTGAGR